MNKVVNQVKELAIEFANKLELEILEVEWVNEFGTNILRIIADAPGSLNIDQATALNEAISEALDRLDLIEDEYMLEVSSPGIERPLKTDEDIINNIGKYVYVKTYEKINGIKEVYGDLVSYEDGLITINYLVKTIRKQIVIQKEKISKIRLAVKF